MEPGRKTRAGFDPDAALASARGTAAEQPACAWPGCAACGLYPAPRSAHDLRRFIWFCLEHIREYNKNWDFFAGMNASEIEAHRRADTTWHRPSWRFGTACVDPASRVQDPFGFFADDGAASAKRHGGTTVPGKAGAMMAVLDLELGFTLDELKRRYKTLVKRHHPDLHNGDRASEERLKQINEAYTYLVANNWHR